MTEADMVDKVIPFLEAQGWEIRCEVYNLYLGRNVDISGVRDGQVLLAEAKKGFTKSLRAQAMGLGFRCNAAYIVIPDHPGSVARAVEFVSLPAAQGVGILAVGAGIREVVIPEDHCRMGNLEKVAARILRYPKGVRGGEPNRRGVGPRQAVIKAVAAYRAEHPKATWKELFENVHNHYEKWQHMYSSLRLAEKRRQFEERLFEQELRKQTLTEEGAET